MMQRLILLALLFFIGCPSDYAMALDINGFLKRACLENLTADPTPGCSEGRLFWDSDDNLFRFHTGSAWRTVADTTATIANPMDSTGDMIYGGVAGAATKLDSGVNGTVLKSSGAATPAWVWTAAYSTKSADYTITDTDGIETILMTTGGTNRTVTLPTAADNVNRVITVKKVDSGTGFVTVDGEGAELINGVATFPMYFRWDWIKIFCDGTSWYTIAKQDSTPWTSVSLTYGTTNQPTNQTAKYRRVGSNLEVQGTGRFNATAGGVASFTIPLSLTADENSSVALDLHVVGVSRLIQQTTEYFVSLCINDADHTSIVFQESSSSGAYTPTASGYFGFLVSIPISGWEHWSN